MDKLLKNAIVYKVPTINVLLMAGFIKTKTKVKASDLKDKVDIASFNRLALQMVNDRNPLIRRTSDHLYSENIIVYELTERGKALFDGVVGLTKSLNQLKLIRNVFNLQQLRLIYMAWVCTEPKTTHQVIALFSELLNEPQDRRIFLELRGYSQHNGNKFKSIMTLENNTITTTDYFSSLLKGHENGQLPKRPSCID